MSPLKHAAFLVPSHINTHHILFRKFKEKLLLVYFDQLTFCVLIKSFTFPLEGCLFWLQTSFRYLVYWMPLFATQLARTNHSAPRSVFSFHPVFKSSVKQLTHLKQRCNEFQDFNLFSIFSVIWLTSPKLSFSGLELIIMRGKKSASRFLYTTFNLSINSAVC